MVSFAPYFAGAFVSVVTGLDRTAALQVMLSRPLVAAPLTGFILGDPKAGLTIGMLLELLWLCRLPVGANIPHDDTQVAVAATTLAIMLSPELGAAESLPLFALLVALPFGKLGQIIERKVRHCNRSLFEDAQSDLSKGLLISVSSFHLRGLINFALGSLVTYTVIIFAGYLAMYSIPSQFIPLLTKQSGWIKLALVLVGVATLLQALNVRRGKSLFFSGFLFAYMLLEYYP